MVPFFYAILIWFVFLLEWREGRSASKLGWFFPSTDYYSSFAGTGIINEPEFSPTLLFKFLECSRYLYILRDFEIGPENWRTGTSFAGKALQHETRKQVLRGRGPVQILAVHFPLVYNKRGWFHFLCDFDLNCFPAGATWRLRFWRDDIPGEAKWRIFPLKRNRNLIGTNYYWNKCFLVVPLDIFLRQVTRTDPNAWWNLLYLRFICWRERESALILVLKMWLILRRDCGSPDSIRDCLMITVMDFWIC